MKKVNKLFSVLLLALMTINMIPQMVFAQTVRDTVRVDYDKFMYLTKEWNGRMINITEEYIYRQSTGQHLYCVEPKVLVTDGAVVTGTDDRNTMAQKGKMTPETLQKIERYAYYGYKYGNHTSMDWYWATQMLIWKTVDPSYQFYPTDADYNRTTRYDAMMNEVKSLGDNHKTTVSFNNQKLEMKVGEQKTLTDTNGVLQYLNTPTIDGLRIVKNGNTLTITALKPYSGNINFPLSYERNMPMIFFADGEQSTILQGDPIRERAVLKVDVLAEFEFVKYYGSEKKGVWKAEKDAVFQIIDKETNEVVTTISTNADGIGKADLKIGTYIVKQTRGKEGYRKIADYELVVDGSESKIKLTFKNHEPEGKPFIFTKTDMSTGKPLPNTKICIYKEGTDEEVLCDRTDRDGQITIKELAIGKYYFIESEAPEGYVLNTDKHYFEVKDEHLFVKANLENKMVTGKLEFTKTDFSTGEVLPNTKITIYDARTNKEVFSGRTDKDGKIVIEELPYGKYYILETEAPEGYELNPEKMYFEIKEDGEIVKSNMKDHKIKKVSSYKVPDTADFKDIAVSVGIILLLGGAGFVVFNSKKNDK